MDQPFESDVMEDLAAETPISSADEYHAMEEGFDDFGDGMEELADADLSSFEENSFGDELDGDLWDDYQESGDEFKPHRTNQRESNRPKHEQGQRRRGMDRGGERGDDRRQVPRRRPPGHRGPWPPRPNSADEFFSEEMNEFEDEFGDGFGEEFASDDDFTEGESVDVMDAMEDAIADALEAEDSDEFLRRFRRALNVVRQVGRGVGSVARVVAPVASAIPHPAAQTISRVASVAGRLLADGADEFEALDEMLAFAEEEDAVDAAAPIIAGLTIRTMMPRASRLNRTTRRQLVQSVRRSAQMLSRSQGARSVRAIPRVIQAVDRTTQRRRIPTHQLPQAIGRATTSVARDPRLVSRLARATHHASTVTRRYGIGTRVSIPQRLVIRGPVEITIRSQ